MTPDGCLPQWATGGWAREPDGGLRRVTGLWRTAADGTAPRGQATLATDRVPPQCVGYSLTGGDVGTMLSLADHPIAMCHYGVIGEGRIAPCPGLTFIAVFTRPNAPVRAADLRWLEHVARGLLVVVLANKPLGLSIDAGEADVALNLYDMVRDGVAVPQQE